MKTQHYPTKALPLQSTPGPTTGLLVPPNLLERIKHLNIQGLSSQNIASPRQNILTKLKDLPRASTSSKTPESDTQRLKVTPLINLPFENSNNDNTQTQQYSRLSHNKLMTGNRTSADKGRIRRKITTPYAGFRSTWKILKTQPCSTDLQRAAPAERPLTRIRTYQRDISDKEILSKQYQRAFDRNLHQEENSFRELCRMLHIY